MAKIFSKKSLTEFAGQLTTAKTTYDNAVKNTAKPAQENANQKLPVDSYIFEITDSNLQPIKNADGKIIGYTADRTISKIQLIYNLNTQGRQRQYFNIYAEETDKDGVPINLGNWQGQELQAGSKLSKTQDVSAAGLLAVCIAGKLDTLTVKLTWTTSQMDECFYIEVEDYDLKPTATGWQALRRARRMPDPACNPQTVLVFKNIYARENNNGKPSALKEGGTNITISGGAKGSGERFTKNIAKINNSTAEEWVIIDKLDWVSVSEAEIKEAIKQLNEKFWHHNLYMAGTVFYSGFVGLRPGMEQKIPSIKSITDNSLPSTPPQLKAFIDNLNKLKAAGYTSFEVSVSHCCGNSRYLAGSDCQQIVDNLYTVFIESLITRGYKGKISDFKRGNIDAWQENGKDVPDTSVTNFHVTKVVPSK